MTAVGKFVEATWLVRNAIGTPLPDRYLIFRVGKSTYPPIHIGTGSTSVLPQVLGISLSMVAGLWTHSSAKATSAMLAALPSPQPSRRPAKRSGDGCSTCKQKKVRCDLERPVCNRCVRLQRICDYTPRPRKPYPPRKRVNREALSEPLDKSPGGFAGSGNGPGSMSGDALDDQSSSVDGISEMQGLPSYYLDAEAVEAACSLAFGAHEREAIHHFQSTFSRLHHTKSPKYNVIAIIFNIATKSPLAMHMVVSIARREMLSLRSAGQADIQDDDTSIRHYSAALRMVAAFVNGDDAETGLDTILATVWLMLSYEQRFGDGDGSALSSHLKGLASIVQNKARNPLMLPADEDHHSPSSANTMELSALPEFLGSPTLFSARMLVWISLLDAGAASTGLGGDFNAALHGVLSEHAHNCQGCEARLQRTLFRSYIQMQKYSYPLFCRVWAEDYPVAELMDDVDNHEIFELYVQCFQLRYMVSRLHESKSHQPQAAAQYQSFIETAFHEVAERFTETFILATRLTQETDHSVRHIKNIRFIVPHFHAAVLFYLQCVDSRHIFAQKWVSALKGIMNLAFQAFKYEGDEAMLRIAWPLFMAILETDDHLHRDWISARLRALGKYGKNYARAANFIDFFVAEEERQGKKLDFQVFLKSGGFEQFAI